MVDLDERDRAVLVVMMDGRANPYLIREKTDLDKGEVNTVLVRLGRAGYVEQVTRGLYEITEKGRDAVNGVE
jgi:predicted transcriptional regulator